MRSLQIHPCISRITILIRSNPTRNQKRPRGAITPVAVSPPSTPRVAIIDRPFHLRSALPSALARKGAPGASASAVMMADFEQPVRALPCR